METQRHRPRLFSFEFFPPKTPEGEQKLRAARAQLAQLKPAFMSCTFGAGGSTQEGTLRTVLEMHREGHAAAPHISCIGSKRETIAALLDQYREAGIRRLVCLRGDLPSGMAVAGEFRYAADLVRFVRAHTGDWFHVEVAAYPEFHPQARRPAEDLAHFREKVEAGANSATPPDFYNRDAYAPFVGSLEALEDVVGGTEARPRRRRGGGHRPHAGAAQEVDPRPVGGSRLEHQADSHDRDQGTEERADVHHADRAAEPTRRVGGAGDV